jgi:nicotinate-nucleotide adenylyltransferase
MLRAALADAPWAEISTWELDREEPSYSWMTVEHFTRSQPDRKFAWILGSDQWNAIETWARPDFLAKNLTFIPFPRDGIAPVPKAGFRMAPIQAATPGSATEIRRRVREGQSIDGLVAPTVKDYIAEHRLYLDAP